MTDLETDGGKGNYLKVQVRINITKPLNRVRKVWSKGSVIKCAILKYKHLSNFCYWCGLVSHNDKDYGRWLQSKGSLKKSDQHFGDWTSVEIDLNTRKTSITVPGSRPRHPKTNTPFNDSPRNTFTNSPVKQPFSGTSGNPKPSASGYKLWGDQCSSIRDRLVGKLNIQCSQWYTTGTIVAHVEESNIKSANDGWEIKLKSPHFETIGKMEIKPTVQTQSMSNTHGPPNTDKPNKIPQSQHKPLPAKPTWIKIPHEKKITLVTCLW